MLNFSKKFAIFILLCLGIIIYSNSFDSSFHFDDHLSIVSNLSIRSLGNIQKIWDFWPTRFITYLSVALNYFFSNLNVFGYHLVNLVIHLSASVLTWYFIMLIFSTPVIKQEKISRQANLIAFIAAAIFLSHPIQTQAVTYIIQRATSLAAFFCLLCLAFYIKARLLEGKYPKSPLWKIYHFSSILFAGLAMFTKETAVILPLLVVLCEFCFFKQEKAIAKKRLSPFLITLVIVPLTMIFTKSVNFAEMRLASEPVSGISPIGYLLTEFRVIVTYLRILFFPINQNLDYDFRISRSSLDLPTTISLLLLSAILFIAVKIFRKYRIISFSIFWFFITLLPESSIIPIKDVIFEHRLYLSMVGFSIFLVSSLFYLLGEKKTGLIAMLLAVIVVAYSILTYARNYAWKDEITLWSDTIKKSPKKARSYCERGNAYRDKGRFVEAIADFNKAIEMDPRFANAYNNRGVLCVNIGKPYDAIADFNRAIKIDPNPYFSYYNRGNAYKELNRLDVAISDYTKAIQIKHDFALAFHNRGSAYYDQGRLDEAISDYSQAVRIEPNLSLSYLNRGNAYKEQGKLDSAISDYTRAIQIEPKLAGAYLNRAAANFLKYQYAKSWADVRMLKVLGYAADSKFIKKLQEASGLKE